MLMKSLDLLLDLVVKLMVLLDCRGQLNTVDVEHGFLFVLEVGEGAQELPIYLVVG